MHRNLASAGVYSRPNKKGEHQNVSGVMGIAYNPFLDSEAGSAHRNHKVTELLKFWTEKIIEIDPAEREKPSLGLNNEKMPEVRSVPHSNKRVELKTGNGKGMRFTNLGVVWKKLRKNATFGASISHMGNARAIAWHKRCGTRITKTSA